MISLTISSAWHYDCQMPSLIAAKSIDEQDDEHSLSFLSSILLVNLSSSTKYLLPRLLISVFVFLANFSFNLVVVIDLIDSVEAFRIGWGTLGLIKPDPINDEDDDAVDFNSINCCCRGGVSCSDMNMTSFNASISLHIWHLIWPNSQPICFVVDACTFDRCCGCVCMLMMMRNADSLLWVDKKKSRKKRKIYGYCIVILYQSFFVFYINMAHKNRSNLFSR